MDMVATIEILGVWCDVAMIDHYTSVQIYEAIELVESIYECYADPCQERILALVALKLAIKQVEPDETLGDNTKHTIWAKVNNEALHLIATPSDEYIIRKAAVIANNTIARMKQNVSDEDVAVRLSLIELAITAKNQIVD